MALPDWAINKNNPHLKQLKNKSCYDISKQHPFTRLLRDDFPRMKYKRTSEEISVVHWGQRKLLLEEVEFLTRYSDPQDIIVYIGAAPGDHIALLADMFPHNMFYLYDLVKFNIAPNKKIVQRQKYFGEKEIKEFKDKKILFISDIRTWEHFKDDPSKTKDVVKNMMDQMSWHIALKPKKSLLKFRLPFQPGKTEYLDGEIFLQCWAPCRSTEARLVPYDDNRMKTYDNTTYEEQMFYFNNVLRLGCYPHHVIAKGLDHCYDCTAEVYILKKYLIKMGKTTDTDEDKDKRNKMIGKMSDEISKFLSHGKHTLSTYKTAKACGS
jgi:hypothetical protein